MATVKTRKPYEILFELRPDYLFVSLSGENSYEMAKLYWAEIINMQSLRRYSNVLVEMKFSRRLNTHDAFRILTEVAFVSQLGVKFAFLDPYFDVDHTEFEEQVAANRGMSIKNFTDVASAEVWLVT